MGRDNEFKRAPKNISEYKSQPNSQLAHQTKPVIDKVSDSHINFGFDKPAFPRP